LASEGGAVGIVWAGAGAFDVATSEAAFGAGVVTDTEGAVQKVGIGGFGVVAGAAGVG